jgi:hypothetical protein
MKRGGSSFYSSPFSLLPSCLFVILLTGFRLASLILLGLTFHYFWMMFLPVARYAHNGHLVIAGNAVTLDNLG